jgi:hypothetical protein
MVGGIKGHILLLPVKKARPVKTVAAAIAYATNSGLTAYTPATSKAEGMRAVPTLKLDIVREGVKRIQGNLNNNKSGHE